MESEALTCENFSVTAGTLINGEYTMTFATSGAGEAYEVPSGTAPLKIQNYALGEVAPTQSIDIASGSITKTLTVAFTNLEGLTAAPKIYAGNTELDGCVIQTNKVVCTPTAAKIPVAGSPYTINYAIACTEVSTPTGITLTVTDSSSSQGGNTDEEGDDAPAEVTVQQATYNPTCTTDFSTISISVAITNGLASTPKITLSKTDDATKTLEWTCPVIAKDATAISCTGAPSTVAASRTVGTYNLTKVEDSNAQTGVSFKTPEAQTATFEYKEAYTLGTNANQTVDYKSEDKLNFTVTFTGMTGSTAPGIKLGSKSVSNCSLANSVVTCFPTKEEVPKSDDPYELKYVDPCGVDVTTGKYVEVSTSFALKASSLALVIAMFIL